MTNSLRRKNPADTDSPARSGIPLTLPSMLAVLFLALVAISSSYLVGVMFGRSQWESSSPMSTDSDARAPEASVAEEDEAAPLPGDAEIPASGETDGGADDERGGILAAEELRFSRVLRAAPGESVELASPPLPPAVPPQPVPASPAANSAAGQTQTAPPPMPPGMRAAVPEGQVAPPPAPAAMHDYVFQVGAFRDEISVDDLRQRLEGRGLRTRMERSGKLYLVLVLLRGTDERAAEVPRIMEELRLGKPLLRSRKPVLR